jgi:predicted lipase
MSSFPKLKLQSLGTLVDMTFQEDTGITISFRAAEDSFTWIYRSMQWKTDALGEPGCKVHAGFQGQLDRVARSIFDFLDKCPSNLKVQFKGHSLGGPVAVLAGAHAAQRYPKRMIHVTTTGSPMVGNSKFRAWCDRVPNFHFDRIIIEEDLVPRIK